MFDQILDLVGQPPGSLVYHFIILFAIEAALAIGVGQWMRDREPGSFRLSLALFAIFCSRVAILIASLAAWQGYLPRNVLLPPVERAVDTMTILAMGWAFITMNHPPILNRNFAPDVISALTFGILAIGLGGTYYFWSTGTSTTALFNGLWIDIAWSAAQIGLSLVALAWMFFRSRYVYDLFLKAIMLALLAGAAAFHLIRPVGGDVSAAMRVGQIIVIPMIAAVAYRHVVDQLLNWDTFEPSRLAEQAQLAPGALAAPEAPQPIPPAPPVPPPPETLQETVKAEKPALQPDRSPGIAGTLEIVDSIGDLLATLEPGDLVLHAPRAVATALRADMCVLAIVDESVQQAAILGGYDNITQTGLRQDILDLSDHPTIVNALGRLRQMRMTVQRNGRELRDLYTRLHINHEGPAYVQPMIKGEERIGVLIAASPYSRRLLSTDERNLLDRLAPLVTAALINAETYKEAQETGERASAEEASRAVRLSDELTARIAELNASQRQNEEMKSYIRDLHRQLEEVPQQQEAARNQVQKLVAEIDRLRQQTAGLEKLEAENQRLRDQQAQQQVERRSPSPEQILLQQQLDEARLMAQTEIASLRTRLIQASISQQEAAFLQEQLAIKARELVQLQTRLTETEAVSDALRKQVADGLSSTRELEVMQKRVAEQASEIARLKADLAETQAATRLDEDALRAQQTMEQADREALAKLQAQLAERAALADELSRQLQEKVRATIELKTHMAEVNESLRSLEEQLNYKTEEIATLQESLAQTRQEAQDRIAALHAELESGAGDTTAMAEARAQALEAQLAEKATSIETLEAQLEHARHSMADLERQLNATNQAVDAAISDARQVDSHDEVIASIAQELRTPMSSIMGYTELLLRESVGILGPLQRKFLQRVKANTERLGTLLDDLIRITTIDTGTMQLEPEKIDVFYAIEEVIMGIANQYSEKGLTLRIALPDQLPPVIADRDALIEVIQHLLLNAALASPVQGHVDLAAHAVYTTLPGANGHDLQTDCLSITVKDSGEGIAPDDYDRVFMRKYRADNPLIDGLGDTGVGLSLAKALVNAHGGRIWLESEKGAGTTFQVLIPLEPIKQGDA